jgi:hypothetical protein
MLFYCRLRSDIEYSLFELKSKFRCFWIQVRFRQRVWNPCQVSQHWSCENKTKLQEGELGHPSSLKNYFARRCWDPTLKFDFNSISTIEKKRWAELQSYALKHHVLCYARTKRYRRFSYIYVPGTLKCLVEWKLAILLTMIWFHSNRINWNAVEGPAG